MHCKQCKNKVSQYAKMCPYCHARLNQNERATRQYMKMLTENKFPHSKDGSKFDKKIGIALFSVFLVVTTVLIAFKDQTNEWQITGQTVFYMQEDGLFGKDLKKNEKRRIVDLSQETVEEKDMISAEQQAFHYDNNTDRIYYAKEMEEKNEQVSYSIFMRNTSNWSKTPAKVAGEVRFTNWDRYGSLYYACEESKLLYKYDGSRISSIELPLVKEMHEVQGTDDLFIVAYQARHGGGCYEFSTYDETDSLIFYLLDTKTFTATKLFDKRIESYAYTEDGRHLYYQIDNVLYDYDLVKRKENIFEKNIYEFLLLNENDSEKLYYISYQTKETSLYTYVNDPYAKEDAQLAKTPSLLAKKERQEQEDYHSRQQFRKELKEEKIYLFEGTLYQYQDGKKVRIGEHISMLDSLYKSMVSYEPFIYKEKEIEFGSYELKKEGMEDIGSVYDMVVNLIDGQIRNYDINYESLLIYMNGTRSPKKQEVLMCCEDSPYKVHNGILKRYEAEVEDEEDTKSCITRSGDSTFYISWYQEYTLFEEKAGKKTELLKSVDAYQKLEGNGILALSFDAAKGNYNLYQIDSDHKRELVDTKVTAIVGKNVLHSKGWE